MSNSHTVGFNVRVSEGVRLNYANFVVRAGTPEDAPVPTTVIENSGPISFIDKDSSENAKGKTFEEEVKGVWGEVQGFVDHYLKDQDFIRAQWVHKKIMDDVLSDHEMNRKITEDHSSKQKFDKDYHEIKKFIDDNKSLANITSWNGGNSFHWFFKELYKFWKIYKKLPSLEKCVIENYFSKTIDYCFRLWDEYKAIVDKSLKFLDDFSKAIKLISSERALFASSVEGIQENAREFFEAKMGKEFVGSMTITALRVLPKLKEISPHIRNACSLKIEALTADSAVYVDYSLPVRLSTVPFLLEFYASSGAAIRILKVWTRKDVELVTQHLFRAYQAVEFNKYFDGEKQKAHISKKVNNLFANLSVDNVKSADDVKFSGYLHDFHKRMIDGIVQKADATAKVRLLDDYREAMGLSYLFMYYAVTIFDGVGLNSNDSIENQQIQRNAYGPLSKLVIKSKVHFRRLFLNMSPDAQHYFNLFIMDVCDKSACAEMYLTSFRLGDKVYRSSESRISLQQWAYSITDGVFLGPAVSLPGEQKEELVVCGLKSRQQPAQNNGFDDYFVCDNMDLLAAPDKGDSPLRKEKLLAAFSEAEKNSKPSEAISQLVEKVRGVEALTGVSMEEEKGLVTLDVKLFDKPFAVIKNIDVLVDHLAFIKKTFFDRPNTKALQQLI